MELSVFFAGQERSSVREATIELSGFCLTKAHEASCVCDP